MDHILDFSNALDHILFVTALSIVYLLRDWKRVLILVTAFTIGHSITLALATLNLIKVNTDLIEFLIPVTILITALSNIFRSEKKIHNQHISMNYVYALVFGLIHGMGFSNYLRSLLGNDSRIVSQLLSFNLGLEIGQIIVVLIVLSISFIFVDILTVNRRDWRIVISSAIAGISLLLASEKIYW